MQSNRSLVIKTEPRIIIDKTFPVFDQLNIGDIGQCLIYGDIEGERISEQQDTEWLMKTIKMTNIELINDRQYRI